MIVYLFAFIVTVCACIAFFIIYKKYTAQNVKVHELVNSEKLFSKVVQSAQEGIVVTDKDAKIIFVNPAFCRICGFEEKELIGQNPSQLKSDKHSDRYYASVWQTIQRYGMWHGEFWNKNKKGELFTVLATLSAVYDGDEITNYVGIQTDISKLKASQKRIEQLAYYDTLTGLPNRVLFQERAYLAMALAERKGETLAILFIDLDRFKEINDSLGHSAGDELLIEASKRLKASIREVDTISRQGGDEFVALLVGATIDSIEIVANRIIGAFLAPFEIYGRKLRITASIGIAVYPNDSQELEDLLKNADIALYHVKNQGKNSWAFYDKTMHTGGAERLSLETELEKAIKENQLVPYYQPKVRISDGKIIGAEALARWPHPERGLIMPIDFIPIAETSSLIVNLGEFMLKEVCLALSKWDEQGINDIRVSVNMAVRHFKAANLTTHIAHILDENSVNANLLELEITESAILETHAQTVDILKSLREIGVKIAIDDFGAGYSNLSYLKRLPIDTLKIDQAFVKDIDKNSDDKMIVSTIIAMGQGLGLEVIAEGVETIEQKEVLASCKCEYAQGYLYGKPMPANEFVELVLQNKKLSANLA
ncbi:MAG: hypothetical protein RL154_1115 [Pseudomonadota bacterium]|jgi:diguanylate cyclase (GGDEF)-like protein/PAS domain S-box-containing protein